MVHAYCATMSGTGNSDVKNVIIGALVGFASILPGVSGGLFAVLCGVYERLIEDLSDIRHKLFSDFRFIFTLFVGLCIGMMVCALLLDVALSSFSMICMAFFFGLIVAQIPDVYGFADDGKETRKTISGILGFVFGLAIICVLMFYNTTEGTVDFNERTPLNMILFMLTGIVLAISKIIPGISGSSLLIALGLFDITISSMAHLDLYFLIPLGIGVVVGVLAFAKVMDVCLKKHRVVTYMTILGLTIGSLLIIIQEIVTSNPGTVDIIVCVVSAVIGTIAGYAFNEYGKKYLG